MTPQLSRNFNKFLNSLEPKLRFKVQTEFALSDDPVRYARNALLRNAGGINNA
jgi:hypothetical protein